MSLAIYDCDCDIAIKWSVAVTSYQWLLMQTNGNNKPPVTIMIPPVLVTIHYTMHIHPPCNTKQDNESGSDHQGNKLEVELTLL